MTTLKDLINDVVIQYHNEKDVADDPEVLVDSICIAISTYLKTELE